MVFFLGLRPALMGLGAVAAVRAVLAGGEPDPAVVVVGRERLLT